MLGAAANAPAPPSRPPEDQDFPKLSCSFTDSIQYVSSAGVLSTRMKRPSRDPLWANRYKIYQFNGYFSGL
jgi:hypothetical protein